MEDAKKKKSMGSCAGKPGKALNEVMAGLRKQPAIMNLAGKKPNNKGRA